MIIVVTGGAGGIGSAVCCRFLEAGHNVISLDRKPHSNSAVQHYEVDLSERGNATVMFRKIVKQHGCPSALINCVGYYKSSTLDQFNWEEFDYTQRVNLHGPLEASLAWLRVRSKNVRGVIVNISSAGARTPSRDVGYVASKAALEGISRSMAKSLAGHNIVIFCVAPGVVDTPMSKAMPHARRQEHLQRTWLKRACRPDEIADLVAFLVNGKSDYMTGNVIAIDGGLLSS